MKKRTIKRNILSVLVVMIMLMATLLTACSSGQATETPAKEETTKAEVTEETAEVEQAEEVATPEPTEEPTPEPTHEPVVYEGIDMESTLPGAEWIATFNGIITEPKFVIFNDNTNKKVIVEDGQEVEFSDTDIFAVFFPLEREIVRKPLEDNTTFCNNSAEGNVRFYDDVFPSLKDGDKVEIKQGLEVDGEEETLTVTLVIKRS